MRGDILSRTYILISKSDASNYILWCWNGRLRKIISFTDWM